LLHLMLDQFQPPVLHALCLGAHSDDIEVGCGGTILKLLGMERQIHVTWVVFSSTEQRRREALESAHTFLQMAAAKDIMIKNHRDGFFPYVGGQIKEDFEELKAHLSPDLVFTHYRHDLHQDHRVISELTWNTFRNHLILEYEIPKYDGDLGSPNLFVPLEESVCLRKIDTIVNSFASQGDKHWFSKDLFLSLLRLRGMESCASSGYAEAFYARKVVLR